MREPWLFQRCTIDRVIDGDSFMLDIKTGFYHRAEVHVRLLGVDCPERGRDPEGWRLARAFTENWLTEADTVTFLCTGPDKYGRRWNGVVRNKLDESLSDVLIHSGLGVQYNGGMKP